MAQNRRDKWKAIYDGSFPLRWSELHRLAPGDDRTTYVYAAFAGDICLYVGTSAHFGGRMEKHKTADIWWSQADRLMVLEVHGGPNRLRLWRAGMRAEWSLMEELRPIYNVVGPTNLPSKSREAAV
jgi:hypothetical protein